MDGARHPLCARSQAQCRGRTRCRLRARARAESSHHGTMNVMQKRKRGGRVRNMEPCASKASKISPLKLPFSPLLENRSSPNRWRISGKTVF